MKDKNKDDLEIHLDPKTKFKSRFSKSYQEKFNSLDVKYTKDKKKYIILLIAVITLTAAFFGSSYAYITYVSKTKSSITINAGKLEIKLNEKENALTLVNALPTKDDTGLLKAHEYKFTITNTGDIDAVFNIILNNSCKTGETYKIDNKKVKADKCLLDEYIKIGIKKDDTDFYQVVTKKDKDKYVIDTGYLTSNETVSYTMKLWLSEDTPNIFNGKNGNCIYIGKLQVSYEQKV